ncbi:MAG: hypothetical protein NTZ59_05025 [Bacteroidetes bacterium]|nr:hypothetical protein [Bacteroidota bacterium]
MKNIKWVNEGEKHYLKSDAETLIDLTIIPLKNQVLSSINKNTQ